MIDFLLLELPPAQSPDSEPTSSPANHGHQNGQRTGPPNERTSLLDVAGGDYFSTRSEDATNSRFGILKGHCENLSALEIAAVSGAKKFLSQRPIQKVINGLWRGDIVFWETLSVNSVKRPRKYNRKQADPFSRLRVPRYLKIFETLFFAIFLALYYAVLVRRDKQRVTIPEILLYVWIASFAYDEFADWVDAGQTSFYASDFWWMWDISIVLVGMVFCALRVVGLSNHNDDTIDLAYDVLGLEALFLVPRIFSLLSLNPYFGTLVSLQPVTRDEQMLIQPQDPVFKGDGNVNLYCCLRVSPTDLRKTKDFVKFLSLVLILYLGKCETANCRLEDLTEHFIQAF